ncbi:alpha/beta fold hydrolase [Microbacterium azadirachtae]|uniref:4,5:9,10-diseco-3-hydroxy-5,9,17-trioxoandrosta-1(10),2-diene-4-oate hydrolase n=1 Tax=Microbacterium azadirachtae TaxID=582680 RepID=A0A1I6G7T7_9MICO|nr:alpha/beta fold hydrolase [Microbacterium azadirachtae]SDL37010.1 4,5:9,10-diseco-3-hydroxy-5,9,17-trioxoandrosta-1(10),2-diene-4-oate hydrolase [Microbacterium azadirachtae]SEF67811.1 4,5:9,10-diseco-3-hydroxy-5,9,17-trioxoandrosta-1(10),2-diene-4-oate hydrolase [Microbacterium azadirachtae]SEF68545.1 4,5:9,10-diseco-3-hydroxy-5,9,17-trioxoandrosta-1(10),2-diene-4-oate hydrolase [Microbacterium azadirachtae]SFR38278.1 4,5:9,10-diseco-3-hydroxy-5,9,17-trioxoandrosta-1(10),2-diene-4-oate hydr
MTAAVDTRIIDTPLGSIAVSVVGQGTPLVLMHGGGPGASALANYRDNLEAFEGFQVILPDQPGFGGSYRPTEADLEARSITEISVDATFHVLDALGIDTFFLLGNSLGGATALGMAIAQPTRVAKLVLMAPGGGWLPTGPTPTEGQKEMFRYYNGEGPTVAKMKNFVRVMVANPKLFDDANIHARYEASLDESHIAFYHLYNAAFAKRGGMDPLWKDLDRITADTLLVWGRDDRTITLDGASLMLRNIRRVQLHIFGGCGHWVQVEKKAKFEKLVAAFLQDTE